jgi:hypothetical protein
VNKLGKQTAMIKKGKQVLHICSGHLFYCHFFGSSSLMPAIWAQIEFQH